MLAMNRMGAKEQIIKRQLQQRRNFFKRPIVAKSIYYQRHNSKRLTSEGFISILKRAAHFVIDNKQRAFIDCLRCAIKNPLNTARQVYGDSFPTGK